tara:strand:- start:8568 stop:9062 length:495 start_codon:yes stop_codon:yes gene_type:complete
MDISKNNQIDLLYLTNPNLKIKYNKTNENINIVSLDDIKFYRKRILIDTKEYLRGNKLTEDLDSCFKNYAKKLIEHYKFNDKKDIIQDEYKNMKKNKKNKKIPNLEMINENKKLMKKIKKEKNKIEDFIPVIVKERKKKKIIMPQSKDINLKDPKYRGEKKKSK